MKRLALIAIVTMLTSAAQAGLNGHWIGWADWNYEGSGDHCQAELVFSQSNNRLERTGGQFSCSAVGLTLLPQAWIQQGDQLLVGNEVVGSLKDDHLVLHEKYNDRVTIDTDIQVSAQHMDYLEVWKTNDQKVLYTIKGRLFTAEKP